VYGQPYIPKINYSFSCSKHITVYCYAGRTTRWALSRISSCGFVVDLVSKIKVSDQSAWSQEQINNLATVVSATSSEGFLVPTIL